MTLLMLILSNLSLGLAQGSFSETLGPNSKLGAQNIFQTINNIFRYLLPINPRVSLDTSTLILLSNFNTRFMFHHI